MTKSIVDPQREIQNLTAQELLIEVRQRTSAYLARTKGDIDQEFVLRMDLGEAEISLQNAVDYQVDLINELVSGTPLKSFQLFTQRLNPEAKVTECNGSLMVTVRNGSEWEAMDRSLSFLNRRWMGVFFYIYNADSL